MEIEEEDRCKRVLAPKNLPMKEFTSNDKGHTKTNFTSHAPRTSSSGIMKFYGPAEGIHPPSEYSKRGHFAKQIQFQSRRIAEQKSNSRVWNESRSFNPRDKQTIKVDPETSKFHVIPREKQTIKVDGEASNEPTSAPASLGVSGPGDKYNRAGFRTDYERAKFYVIKSFSEDDVHKCIKYEVWSSTTYGNNKLDAAFHDAQLQTCPVFLFFSVNGSGQFVGLAEMIGKVDFNKSLDFWQLDKWRGFFPVKWHIMKDIPNPHLKHIQLQNNENKPVTYTRDTQEIELKEGLQMLRIFKNYAAKSSILERAESL